jgi:hypothetical protein
MRTVLIVMAFMVLALAARGALGTDSRANADEAGLDSAQSVHAVKRLDAVASASSFDSGGRHYRRIVSQRFFHVRLYGERIGEDEDIVLQETNTRTCCAEGSAEEYGAIELRPYLDSAGQLFGPRWKSRIDADEGRPLDRYYRGTLYGCCDQTNEILFVSLRTGKIVFTASTPGVGDGLELASIDVPNGYTQRFAAFHDSYTANSPPESKKYADLVGVLQYGPPEGPAKRFLLRCAGHKPTDYQFDSLAFQISGKDYQPARLWGSNGNTTPQAYTGFQIHLQMRPADSEKAVSVLIPVDGDSLVLHRAVVPMPCQITRGT